MLQSGRRDVVFSRLADRLGQRLRLLARDDRVVEAARTRTPPTEMLDVDVGRVTAAGRERFFVCNLGVGFNGMVNGEARKTRWLAGMPLYAWAFLKAMVKHFATPTMTIRFDDREVTTPTLALSVLNGQREGNFPLRPDGEPHRRAVRLHARDAAQPLAPHPLPARDGDGQAAGEPQAAHARPGAADRGAVARRRCASTPTASSSACRRTGIREIAVEVVPRRLRVEVYPPALYGGRACKCTKPAEPRGGL